MKKLTRMLLCTAILALLLCTSAFAANDSGIDIQLNGESLTFTDAVPQIVNDRTYLPFRTVFTALGFEDENITYQDETKTVCAASDELTVSMVIGENKVTVVQDGQTTVLDTDVPAFIDPQVSRTYVPARFVSEAAGYRVGWNGDTRTVIIDDVDAILAANQETYSVLDSYLDYGRQFSQKNYQVDGSYSADITAEGETMNLAGTYYMLLANSSTFDFETDMTISGIVGGEDIAAAIPEGIDFDMRGDLASGEFYFKSDALMTMLETGMSNLWFKLDLGAVMDSMAAELGMSYSDLMAMSQEMLKGMDGKTYLETIIRMMADVDTTTSVQEYLTMFNAILGDSAFTKSGSSYVSKMEQDGMTMTMTLTTSGGKVNGYSVVLSGEQADPDLGTIKMSMDISMKDNQMKASIAMDMFGSVTMKMTMDGKYTATTKVPAGAPDENAAVMDLMQMMQLAA